MKQTYQSVAWRCRICTVPARERAYVHKRNRWVQTRTPGWQHPLTLNENLNGDTTLVSSEFLHCEHVGSLGLHYFYDI